MANVVSSVVVRVSRASHCIMTTSSTQKLKASWIDRFEHSCGSSCDDCSSDEREDRKRAKAKDREEDDEVLLELRDKLNDYVEDLSDIVSCFYFEESKARARHYMWKIVRIPERAKNLTLPYLRRLLDKLTHDQNDDPHCEMKRAFAHVVLRRQRLKEKVLATIKTLEDQAQTSLQHENQL